MHYHRRLICGLLAVLMVSGCAATRTRLPDQYTVPAHKPRPVTQATGAALSSAPYLRTVIPANALAYARIPSLWAMLGEPKGNLYDGAVGSAPYRAAVTKIRDGFRENIAPEFKDGSEVLWSLFLAHGMSPAEFLLLPGATPPAMTLLFSMQVELDRHALNEAFSAMSVAMPALRITQRIDAGGDGILNIGQRPLSLHFDQRSRRLFAMLGAQDADLKALLATLAPARIHAMYPLEQSMDTTGQGFFFWASGEGVKQALAMLGKDTQSSAVTKVLAQSRGIALGWGARDKRQRIRLVLDMPQIDFRRYTPLGAQAIGLHTAGEPQAVFMLSLPDRNDLAMIEQGLAESLAPNDFQGYQDGKGKIEARLGYSIEDALSAVGKEWLYVLDDAGWYLAIPLRDELLFNDLLGKLEQKFNLAIERREVNGRQYSHLALPSLMSGGEEDHPSPWQRWGRLPSHLYWTQEDGYLLMASTPQPIIDRYYQTLRTPLQSWLKNQQQQDPAGALLLATVRSEGVPRLLYGFNLELLQSLGDYVGRPLDLFAMPTPHELNLPASGAFSFRVDSTADQLALELSFDSTPLEGLLAGNGMMGLAAVGIISAIAIPAYQEYALRAQVAEVLAGTTPITQTLTAFYQENARFPDAPESGGLGFEQLPPHVSGLVVTPQSGQIAISLALPQLAENNQIMLTPRIVDRRVEWVCTANLPPKYLPHNCR